MTGGAGLQGSRLAKKLIAKGFNVVIADNFSRGSMDNLHEILTWADLIEADLREFEDCLTVTKNVDTVFHLAAHLGGAEYTHGSEMMAAHGSSMA